MTYCVEEQLFLGRAALINPYMQTTSERFSLLRATVYIVSTIFLCNQIHTYSYILTRTKKFQFNVKGYLTAIQLSSNVKKIDE